MAHKKEGKERISDPRVDRIWEYIREKKMNLTKLAKVSGLTYPHVNNMMNGNKSLSYEVLEKIAQGLKLPMEYFLESNIENDRKPKARGNSQLMSEILTHAEEIFRTVEKLNVDGLREFFEKEPTRPLIATGHGGKYSQAVYAALLYSTNQGLGRAVTCYSCNSLSDATIQNSKILLVSKGMANIDIDYIAQRCIRLNPNYTCAMRIVGDDEKKYINTVEKLKECGYSFEFDLDIDLSEHFISISSVLFYSALLYKTFTKDDDFVSKLELNPNPEENYVYSSANGIASVPNLSKITHFSVLYGSYAEPVAYNIESNIVEGGIASCTVSDYKNYTHGRFMVEGNYIKSKYHPQTEAALICLVTPREELIYQDLLEAMPSHLPVITIRTDLLTPLATIDLLYKANMFASHLGEFFHKTNPNDPTLFCTQIDKRIPKNYVDFKPDFKIWGALDAEAEKKLVKELRKALKVDINNLNDLFKIRDEILAKEPLRTEDCRENWKKTKPISWEDFSFRETHVYDTKKQECWSFNSKTDVRDGISLQLGNMANGFGVDILGIKFPNTEVPYQLAIFNNEKDSVKLQEDIINPEKGWLYNGLKMKRTFVRGREYVRFRRDTQFENGKELWCFEWMKWITWEKVRQNEEFRKLLLSIPKEAFIIEQAQRKSDLMWGAWNEDLLAERKIVIRAAQIGNGLGKSSRVVKDEIYKVNNVGEWVGENAEGQILTMAKLALNEGINMPIDEAMLNEAEINWFGKMLHFTKEADGLVTVKTISPRMGTRAKLVIIGNISGDILGSIYELKEDKTSIKALADKERIGLQKSMTYTDDTILTIAIARWLLDDKEHTKDTLIDLIKEYGSSFKRTSFSRAFRDWVKTDSREPFGDADDGSAMRVSPIGYYAKTMEECLELAKISAEVTHNTEEGIRGAQAVAACIFLARKGKSKKAIKEYISETFPSYDLNRKIKDIRPSYQQVFNCDDVVPESIICYLEGKDYEETVKLAISLGGDTDTMACISGGIAAVNMPVPEKISNYAYEILPPELRKTVEDFNRAYRIKPSKE